MEEYSFVFSSFEPHSEKIFSDVFKNSILAKLVFPATLYKNKGKEMIRLAKPSDFSPSIIPEEYRSEEHDSVSLYLHPENGIMFSSSVYSSPFSIPSVIITEFTSEHIENSVCTLDNIVAMVEEGIPEFQIGRSSLFHSKPIMIPNPDGGGSFQRPPIYKRPSGGTYPLCIDWLTFFGEDFLNLIGRKRFNNLKTCYLKEDINNGILVVLQNEPFDNTNPEHMARKEKAETELGLSELVSK